MGRKSRERKARVSLGIEAPHLDTHSRPMLYRCPKCSALTTSPEAHECWVGGHPVLATTPKAPVIKVNKELLEKMRKK